MKPASQADAADRAATVVHGVISQIAKPRNMRGKHRIRRSLITGVSSSQQLVGEKLSAQASRAAPKMLDFGS
jgi:hypothetical protein